MALPQRMPPKQALNKTGEFQLVTKFPGYRAREDATMLPVGTLIAPSQNVVIKTSGRVSLVKGYTLDGATSSTIDSGILSNFDFTNFKGDVRNLRAGFLTSAGNDGKLQYRYVTGTNTVNWIDLKTGLTNVRLSYTTWWDTVSSPNVRQCLWVDGSANIYSWNGAVTTVASATATTVTKQGTNTWAQEGFSATGSISINGTDYTYTGGTLTTTLTGLSVDLSATPAGTVTHQSVVTTSSFTSMPLTSLTVIGTGRKNAVYVGSNTSSQVYMSTSKLGVSFSDFSYSSPRLSNEGFYLTLSGSPTVFIAQEDRSSTDMHDMYISYGHDSWSMVVSKSTVTFTSDGSATNTTETIDVIPLKVAPLQGAKSERLAGKMKNEIMFVGNDGTANFLGYQSYQYVPAIVDFSFPIIDDMNSYDFTDASIFYHKNYVYIAIPKAGVVRIYNMTDQTKQYTSFTRDMEDVTQQPWFWESPITYPIAGFYVVNGELYGHSYTTSESYKLFTTGSFNGQDIDANATFAYDDKGDRTQSKGSDELWAEGYIAQNTKLNATVTGDLDTSAESQTVVIDGANSQYVAYGAGAHSLGKNNLGTNPLGGANTNTSTRPAWFHVAKTYPQVPFYLELISFATKGVDLAWELICFGTNSRMTAEGNNEITD